ncbi:MAG: 50S ribosomal protein L29 [archaeon]
MNDAQLNEKMVQFRKELISLNAQIAVGTAPEKPSRVREIKKNIARIIMIQHLNKKSKMEVQQKK